MANEKKNTKKKKKGVSPERKAKAKKAIVQAIHGVNRGPGYSAMMGVEYSHPKGVRKKKPKSGYVWDKSGKIKPQKGVPTLTYPRSKALLKNVKSKVAKRGAAKSKKK